MLDSKDDEQNDQTNDFDPDDDLSPELEEAPGCPFCQGDGCEHLLASCDMSFGEGETILGLGGGTLYEKSSLIDAMFDVVVQLVHEQGDSGVAQLRSKHLRSLAEDIAAAYGDKGFDKSARHDDDANADAMSDLCCEQNSSYLEYIREVQEQTVENSGESRWTLNAPSMTTDYINLYAYDAKSATDLMVKQIEKDLATVKSLLKK